MITIRVRELRQNKELTQEELASQLGISRQSVIALENGRYMPSLPLACEIAKFFEVELDNIISFVESNLSLTNSKEDIMNNRSLQPWSPFREFRSIQEEMDRLFEDSLLSRDRAISPVVPAVNLRQDEKNLYVEMPVPGYKEEDLDIDVAPEYITISGQVRKEDEEKKKGYFRQEYRSQSFTRTVPFPVPVDADQAEANIENGLLAVILPKTEPEKPQTKKLSVKKK